jgi:hypothetical protein
MSTIHVIYTWNDVNVNLDIKIKWSTNKASLEHWCNIASRLIPAKDTRSKLVQEQSKRAGCFEDSGDIARHTAWHGRILMSCTKILGELREPHVRFLDLGSTTSASTCCCDTSYVYDVITSRGYASEVHNMVSLRNPCTLHYERNL